MPSFFSMNLLFRLFFLGVIGSLSSCQVGRFIVYNFADIQDYKKFPTHELTKSATPFKFASINPQKGPKSLTIQGVPMSFEDYLDRNRTVAFLIIRKDTILYERYFKKYDEASIVPSFSMAKSVTSMLMGCAIEEGMVNSLEDPITDYVEELQGKEGFDKIKILHLMQMTSGIKFDESYVNPFGHAASFYYGLNLRRVIKNLKIARAPGTKFSYSSGDTQILGFILSNVIQKRYQISLTDYLQKKIWTPLNMEYPASWSLDSKKGQLEKTFCCLNARARDFAKLGRLYLEKGNWEGEQLVPEDWVANSTKVETTQGSASYYQYQWWLPNKKGDYMAQGILGQFIYVHPDKEIIIVRLGKAYGKDGDWPTLFQKLAEAY